MGSPDLSRLSTEGRNPATMSLDAMTPLQIVDVMNSQDSCVIEAIARVKEQIAQAISCAAKAMRNGGRLVYVGAGTSGRLGVLDATECPPTFGVPASQVIGVIAGGPEALTGAVEGSEDDRDLGVSDMQKIGLSASDMVVGLSASGRTPYVLSALDYARSLGCMTAAIACSDHSEARDHADLVIEPVVGPEVLTGSTRLKSGTAQKLVLNMISTGSMVLLGKVYENLMVDVQLSNEKLVARARRIVMEATGCSADDAERALDNSNGSAKVAVVMVLNACDAAEAREALDACGGRVRDVIRKL